MKDGLKLAILYSLKPHQLGFCGPQDKRKGVLLEYLKGDNISDEEVRKVLEGFEGEYPYLKLIAESNSIENPFDKRVVKAYWVGNELLDNVKISDLREMVVKGFSKPGLLLKEMATKKAQLIPENSKPHHSFHVLVMGSVTGKVVLKGRLLDLCRIGWGKVREVQSKLLVEYQPLVGDKELKLGKAIEKEINWDKELVLNVKAGDWISFHWNQVVGVLSDEDKKNLEKYTRITLESLRKSF